MTRKFKALGLAILALCAMSAFAASSASANFDGEVEHVNLEGNQTGNHVFTTAVGTVTCKKAKFTGTSLSGTAVVGGWTTSDITVAASYSECTAFGFSATVNMNGCEYTMTRTTIDANSVPIGPVHVICPGTNKIKIVAAGFCTMEVGAQTPEGHVSYKNEGAGKSRDVLVTSTVTGISYSGNCGSGSGGTYSGGVTTKGFNTAGEQVGIWTT